MPGVVISSSVRDDGAATMVRAGAIWWVVSALCIGLNVMVVLVFGLEDASAVDRVVATAVTAAQAATTVAVTTERWEVRGRSLVGRTILQVLIVPADQVSGVAAENGLEIVLRSGRRLELTICQPSLAQLLIRNGRRRREADRIEAWLASVHPVEERSWAAATWDTRVRWPAVVGIGAWTVLAPVLTLLLATVR